MTECLLFPPLHYEEYESCPVTDEADINPGNHQGLSLFHVRSFSHYIAVKWNLSLKYAVINLNSLLMMC